MSDNVNTNVEQTEQEYNEVVRIRREKLASLKAEGNNPYEQTSYIRTANSAAAGTSAVTAMGIKSSPMTGEA